jgi:hypothetical protein
LTRFPARWPRLPWPSHRLRQSAKKPTRAERKTAQRKVTFGVAAIPVATFACLLKTSDLAEAKRVKGKFVSFCIAHPDYTDWRDAWNVFANRATPNVEAQPIAERGNVVVPIKEPAQATVDFINAL